jgi:hypothetical protein
VKGRETPSPFQLEQDEWQQMMWEEVALSVGQWLTDAQINLSRPIRSLKQRELLGMAWAAIGTYHELRTRRLRQLEAAPDPRRPTLPDAA